MAPPAAVPFPLFGFASFDRRHVETRTARSGLQRRSPNREGLPCNGRRTVTTCRPGPATETLELRRPPCTSPERPPGETACPVGCCTEKEGANTTPDRIQRRQRARREVPRSHIGPRPDRRRSLPESLASPPSGSDRVARQNKSSPRRTAGITPCLLQHVVVCNRNSFFDVGLLPLVERIHRRHTPTPASCLHVEASWAIAAPDDSPTKLSLGQGEHPSILVERTTPRNYLVQCEHPDPTMERLTALRSAARRPR